MKNLTSILRITSILVIVLALGSCTRKNNPCNSTPFEFSPPIIFTLKDRVTGNDILSFPGAVVQVPDSIKLKDLGTTADYPLYIATHPGGVIIYSPEYSRPANVTDSLVFYFGNSIPDTLVVTTGLVDGWRGDECPMLRDPGIVKVTLRNQVLLEVTDDNAIIPLVK